MNKKEKQIVKEIMNRYSKVHYDMELLEKSLDKLHKEKDDLLKELKQIRKNESLVIDTLKEKYGEDAELDLKTLELI
tara:strand:- start:615 stop:845 length:231 start_codon:yes stop_codon:yes gene_type:complete